MTFRLWQALTGAEASLVRVLDRHQVGVTHLLDAGGEMAVPEPRHPLGERPVGGGHPVQPPTDELGALLLQHLRRRGVLWHAIDGSEYGRG